MLLTRPRALSLVVAVLTAAFAVAATTAGAASKVHTVPAKVWVGAVCGSIDAWDADLEARLAAVGRMTPAEPSPASARDALASAYGGAAARTDELVVMLSIAGTPAGKGGRSAARELVATYRGAAEALREARDQVASAPDELDAVSDAAAKASTTLGVTLAEVVADGSGLPAGRTALARLVANDPTCTRVALR